MQIIECIKKVEAVTPEQTVDCCLEILINHGVLLVPVVDDKGLLLGIVKHSDILKYIKENDNYKEMKKLKAGDFLSNDSEIITMEEKIKLDTLVAMRERDVLVVDGNGKFMGILDKLKLAYSFYEDLKSYLSHYDTIFESSYDGILVSDHNGVVLRVNRAYERLTGIKEEQVLGKTFKQLIDEGLYSKSVVDLVKSTGKAATVMVAPSDKHLLCTGNPVYNSDGELELVVINMRDITELNRMRHELENAKELTERYQTELTELRMQQIEEKGFVVNSVPMRNAVEMALRVSKTDSTVFISGESGVGKEVIAKLIHSNSSRSKGPFIKINCASIPNSLLESELFGYEEGAFTGAKKQGKPGLIETADGGTVLLDEIAEMPLALQVKLLRFLQEREFVRVGGTKPRKVDVRILAATNKDLHALVRKGLFRDDLFFRLYVVPVYIPPLRERKEDIVPLLYLELDKLAEKYGVKKDLAPDVVDILTAYEWPGNIRELQNVVERLYVTSIENMITKEYLPQNIVQNVKDEFVNESENISLKKAVLNFEYKFIMRMVERYGSIASAAEILKVDQSTIFRKIKKYKELNKKY